MGDQRGAAKNGNKKPAAEMGRLGGAAFAGFGNEMPRHF